MKNLNEDEIFSRLYAERKNPKISRKELIEPDYEIWGRARAWLYHQAVCLIAGICPIARTDFEGYVIYKSHGTQTFGDIEIDDSDDFLTSLYPFKNDDFNKLRTVESSMRTLLKLSFQDNPPIVFVNPSYLLDRCKNSPEIALRVPGMLIKVVEAFGSHPSRNLPDHFSLLELNADQVANLARKITWQKSSGAASNQIDTIPAIVEKKSVDPREFHLRPEQLAKQAARAMAALIWKSRPKLPTTKLVNVEDFKKIMDLVAKFLGKKDGYMEETLCNWIRDLNPGFKPRL